MQILNRPRRNRKSTAIREMLCETRLDVAQLVYPLFIVDGNGIQDEVKSMPGNYRWSLDLLLKEIESCIALGIQQYVLFPAVEEHLKDNIASYSYSNDNFYLNAINKIKTTFPQITLISDVAMDPYSSDGHDGFVANGQIDNDATLPILAQMTIAQAQAGIDIIGPSDMMDGRVGFLRQAMDKEGFVNTSIMSYTAKYASAYYGPFRDALDSAPKAGDKKTYQMNPANKMEAVREANLDESEGADILMVKPAILYLDVIQLLKQNSNLPIAAYNVSGECSMLMAAAQKGYLNYEAAMQEMLISIARAGADIILTYFAKDYARLMKK
ncbi:porphobilinogen synthase [Marinifilum caeruleilacunae]|uniref:Delta-aminolevulinic acid dehydratase n=1 Tax=Marinifilum caeruleilacunae TaxID=2499076 RepID=A0ABX1WUY2_9BACT|nr:porphobilinogen synthase [Marinifilum caeruleilacunae]NOU59921.1 porphobilinogen synthase [Marinifilum caeruleilacunae]